MDKMAHNDIAAFHSLLRRITSPAAPRPPRILALCGAGLSAASGLPTFRGSTAALWHTHDPMQLATPEAFAANPGLVWRFYAYRRHVALAAKPNAGHRALAALAAKLDPPAAPSSATSDTAPDAELGIRFLCLTQNVDGLSPRAGHPPASLRMLHGSLFDVRCVEVDRRRCDYVLRDHCADPLCAALDVSTDDTGLPAASGAAPPPPRRRTFPRASCRRARAAARHTGAHRCCGRASCGSARI